MYVLVDDGIAKEDHPATFGWLVRFTPGLPFLVPGLVNVASLLLVLAYYKIITRNAATVES